MAAPLEYDFRVIGRAVVEREIAALEKRFIASASKLNREFAKLGGSRTQTSGATGSGTGASLRFRDPVFGPGRKEQLAQIKANERAAVKAVREERKQVENLNRSRQSIHNQRLREEKQTRVESSKTDAERQRQIDRQSRTQQSLARQRLREEAKSRESAKARVDFVKSTVGGGIGRVASVLGSIGKAGLAVAGISAAGIAASSISQAITLDEGSRRLSIAGRAPGEKGSDPASLSKAFTQTGIATGLAPEQIMSGVRKYVEKTGDLGYAMKNSKTFATVAQGADANVEDVFAMAADMKGKLGLNDPEDMKQAFAIFSQQGKKGKFELKNMASEMPEILSTASNAGVRGVAGARDIGALLQQAMEATGNGSEAATAVNTMFKDFGLHANKIQSGQAFGGRKVQVYEGGDPRNKNRSFADVMTESVSASRGNMSELYKVFGVRGIKALNPQINAYKEAYQNTKGTDAEKDIAGTKAAKASFAKYRDLPASFESVQQDAADAMKSFSVQMEVINTKLKDAVASQLFPEIIKLVPQIAALVPLVSKLVAGFISLVGWLANNPLSGLGIALAGSIGIELVKARIGTVIATGLASIIAGVQAGGLRGGIGAATPTVGGPSNYMGAGMTGLAVGAAVAGTIYSGGIAKFESGENSMAVGGAALNAVRGANTSDLAAVRDAVAEQRKRVAASQKTDLLDDTLDMFGASNKKVEAKTQESYLSEMEQKLAELQMQAAKDLSDAAKAQKDAAAAQSGVTPNRSDKPSGVKTP